MVLRSTGFHVALASALASLTYALEPLKADLSAVEELAAKTKKVEDEGEKKEEHPFITYYPDEFQYTSTYCKPLDAPENENCSAHVKWGFEHGKTGDATAKKLYEKLHYWTSMNPDKASMDDYHKFYYCAPPDEKQKCGQPPCHCSYPPCHMCHFPERPRGCTKDSTDMRCKPPQKAMDYNGWAWPDVKIKGKGPYHVFAIGDWGGMDTMLPPVEGRDPLMPWKGYGLPKPGPTPFPRTRWNKNHDWLMCNHYQFVECYKTWGWSCAPGCGFDKHVDTQPQILVAEAMRKRAEKMWPRFIINVGDNFYWGGIEKTCGTPMDQLSFTAAHQFDQIFESVYHGPGIDGVPWFGCLGNHDWGGRRFNNGWDQQIAYTWRSNRWILPAAYYSVKFFFEEENFWLDMFVLDSNMEDGKDIWQEASHNICGSQFNPWGASCSSQGGPNDVNTCHQWFWDLWGKQTSWLAYNLEKSTASWQVAVTHFPCGSQKNYWMDMHNRLGLDLLVTGHRHDQEFWAPYRLGGLTCFVTGGGGGISSEATPNIYWKRDWYGEAQYGFYDLLISIQKIVITSVDWSGYELLTSTVWPKAKR